MTGLRPSMVENPSEVRPGTAIRARLREELAEAPKFLPRYIIVGAGGVAVGMVSIWCFTEVLGLFYLISGCISGFLSVLNDFTFHEVWTFSPRRRGPLLAFGLLRRFARFSASKAVGFLICISTLAFFTQVIGLHYLMSNLIAIGASFTWNYAASTLWVWARRR